MAIQKSMLHKSGLREISVDESKGVLLELIKTAKREEKMLLEEARNALKKSERALKLVKPYREDIFGESFGIRGGFRFRRFKRLINESLQLAIGAKLHVPVIEAIANEVNVWLLNHDVDKTAKDILPEDKKIIAEVRKAKVFLESAVKELTELDSLRWGTATGSSSIFSWGAVYIPVEREGAESDGLKFRSDWMTPLNRSNKSLERFAKSVEAIFRLQKEINQKYRV